MEVLTTLALVMGGYAMSEQTREHLDTFWELVDEVLNAVLFVHMGLESLVISLRGE